MTDSEKVIQEKNIIPELKPCPFCGEQGFLERRDLPDRPLAVRWFIECRNGDCHLKVETSTHAIQEIAICAWNTRAAEASLAILVAQQEAMRTALENIRDATDPDAVEENYRADDREGCLDYVFETARAALSPKAAVTQDAQEKEAQNG